MTCFTDPPMYLLIVLPLSMLPFIASWVVFETVTLAGYLVVLRRIAPIPLGLWLAITFPAVIINFMCGQNGFLTTALIGGGLLLLDRWPLLAGFVFGLMAYKPHFAILIPLALIVARRWRAFIATAISTILFAAVSLAVFGTPAWRAFIGSIAFTQKIVLERGAERFPQHANHFWRNQDVGWRRRGCVCVSGGGCDIRGVCGGLGLANQPSVRAQSRHCGRWLLDGFPIRPAIRAGVARAADSVAGNGGFRERVLAL